MLCLLDQSIDVLANLSERPFEFLGLESIICDKCGKVSFVYKKDVKDVEKVGDLNFPNFTCTFCGKPLIDKEIAEQLDKELEYVEIPETNMGGKIIKINPFDLLKSENVTNEFIVQQELYLIIFLRYLNWRL